MGLSFGIAIFSLFGPFSAQSVPIPKAPIKAKPRFELEAPLPTVPGVMMDAYASGVGAAQQLAKAYGLQARILWIDGTANIDRVNSEAKIVELVKEIKDCGFNTIVFDVKPISGQVLYNSKIAPHLTEWKGHLLPAEFDPLSIMVREAKTNGLWLFASLNAFSEGHKLFQSGPGFDKPDWQSIIYAPKPYIKIDEERSFDLNLTLNKAQAGMVTEFTSIANLPKNAPDGYAVLVGKDFRLENSFDGPALALGLSPLPGGTALLYGTGAAAGFLKDNYKVRGQVAFGADPEYIPSSDPRETQYPLMVNPNNAEVQRYEISIAQEVVRNYQVDGIIYDDRFRYGGIDADFSDVTRQAFEREIGRTIVWPDDVFKFTMSKTLVRGIIPGPYYDAWIGWRARVLRDYLERVRHEIKSIRQTAELALYVGSWYGDYPALGDNYASPITQAGFWFMTPSYRAAGTAPLLDFLISGCYYPTPTIYDAMSNGIGIGSSIEAAGTLTNRMVRDECWTYAGIDVGDFKDDPDGLLNALQAACASTQGVMVFDLSHGIDPMWPVFERAFSQRKRPPHASVQALANVRRRRELEDKEHVVNPPVIIAAGSAGTGQ